MTPNRQIWKGIYQKTPPVYVAMYRRFRAGPSIGHRPWLKSRRFWGWAIDWPPNRDWNHGDTEGGPSIGHRPWLKSRRYRGWAIDRPPTVTEITAIQRVGHRLTTEPWLKSRQFWGWSIDSHRQWLKSLRFWGWVIDWLTILTKPHLFSVVYQTKSIPRVFKIAGLINLLI